MKKKLRQSNEGIQMIEIGSMLRAEWGQNTDTEGQELKRQQHAGKERLKMNDKGEIKLAR